MFQRDSKLSFLLTSVLCAGVATTMGACGSQDGTSSDGETTESSSSGTGEAGTAEAEATTADDTTTEGTSAEETETTSGGFVPTTDTGEASTTGEPGPNGTMCGNDDECESEICVDLAGFAGICSECRTDQECMDSGAGLNCSLGAGNFFECTSGGAGSMCMSDDACDGALVCAQVVDLGGLFNDQFCSECKADGECDAGEQCVPDFELAVPPAGQRVCAPEGSLEQDALCDEGSQCVSGICGSADVMGFLQLGICSECDSDADCNGGTCTPASADIAGGGGLSGGTCG